MRSPSRLAALETLGPDESGRWALGTPPAGLQEVARATPEAVFDLITATGLAAFYACDVAPGVSQRRPGGEPDRLAPLDAPDATRRLLRDLGGGRAAVTFHVPALHCASSICASGRAGACEHGRAGCSYPTWSHPSAR